MAEPQRGWIHLLGGIAGAILVALGILRLMHDFSVMGSFLAVLGFLIAGWAALDYRRFRRGTPESEVEGGHTIE
jgi:hypothetical protein